MPTKRLAQKGSPDEIHQLLDILAGKTFRLVVGSNNKLSQQWISNNCTQNWMINNPIPTLYCIQMLPIQILYVVH
jgi:hypothetical protein